MPNPSQQSADRDTPYLKLKLYSLNVRGLNTPEKRSQLLSSLQREKPQVVLLQETHFRTDNVLLYKADTS